MTPGGGGEKLQRGSDGIGNGVVAFQESLYYQHKQLCNVIREIISLKMTIHLHCLIPPKVGTISCPCFCWGEFIEGTGGVCGGREVSELHKLWWTSILKTNLKCGGSIGPVH